MPPDAELSCRRPPDRAQATPHGPVSAAPNRQWCLTSAARGIPFRRSRAGRVRALPAAFRHHFLRHRPRRDANRDGPSISPVSILHSSVVLSAIRKGQNAWIRPAPKRTANLRPVAA